MIFTGRFVALIFTVAKRGAVAGVAAPAEAGVFGSILGLACGELVAGIANVRECARIHETGEPCCGDTQRQRFCDASVTKQLRLHRKTTAFILSLSGQAHQPITD